MITDMKLGEKGLEGWKISPSQIKTLKRHDQDAEGCDRKWGYVYLEGLRGVSSGAAQLGTATHDKLEKFFTSGIEIDTSVLSGKLAQAGLEVYPSRQSLEDFGDLTGFDPLIEAHLSFRHDGILYRGFADMLWVEPRCSSCGEVLIKMGETWTCLSGHTDDFEIVPVVADHKTSADPLRWGLTSKTLREDPQGLIYSNFALGWTDAEEVDLQWTYLKTRGRVEAMPVRATLTKTEVRNNFLEHVAPHGQKIHRLVTLINSGDLTKAAELPPNTLACGAFGGCPHAEYCPRSASEIMKSVLGPQEGEDMDLRAKLAAKHGKAPAKKKTGKAEKKTGKTEKKSKTEVEVQGREVNSPEAPKSPEVAREVSKRIGQVGGNKKTKKENARTVAAAAAEAETPEDAAVRAQAALDRIGRAGLSTSDTILLQVSAGLDLFAPSKPRGKALGVPYASGRTVATMRKDGLLETNKEEGEDGGSVYRFKLTDAGHARVDELNSSKEEDEEPEDETEDEGETFDENTIKKLSMAIAEAIFKALR